MFIQPYLTSLATSAQFLSVNNAELLTFMVFAFDYWSEEGSSVAKVRMARDPWFVFASLKYLWSESYDLSSRYGHDDDISDDNKEEVEDDDKYITDNNGNDDD